MRSGEAAASPTTTDKFPFACDPCQRSLTLTSLCMASTLPLSLASAHLSSPFVYDVASQRLWRCPLILQTCCQCYRRCFGSQTSSWNM